MGKPRAPRWLVDLIGVDYFGHVATVQLNRLETEGVIAQVGRLSQLEWLTVTARNVRDADLANLRGLAKLSYLDFGGTHVSDAGLMHLGGLTNVSYLDLRNTRVSDAGLAHLNGLTSLIVLDLRCRASEQPVSTLPPIGKLANGIGGWSGHLASIDVLTIPSPPT
jgi:hypothetical protein